MNNNEHWPLAVTKKDLRIETYRGSGPGGQNRNKRDTAVRMTHVPTGTVSTAQDQRTQGANIKIAFQRLAEKLVPLMKAAAQQQKYQFVNEIVRSYREPDRIVNDKRLTGTFDYYEVMNGKGLDEIIENLVKK
jgi:peptide chain release factor 1